MCPQTRKHLHHRNRIRTKGVDVVVHADPIQIQELRPDVGHLPYQLRARRNQLAASGSPLPLGYPERGGEFAALDLSTRAFRDVRYNLDQSRDLERCQAFAGEIAKPLCADLAVAAQDDGGGNVLAKSPMGDGESGNFDHIRMTKQRLFHCGGGNLFAVPLDDDLGSAAYEEISVPIDVFEITSSEPTVAKRGRGRGGIVVVSPGNSGTSHHNLSALTSW